MSREQRRCTASARAKRTNLSKFPPPSYLRCSDRSNAGEQRRPRRPCAAPLVLDFVTTEYSSPRSFSTRVRAVQARCFNTAGADFVALSLRIVRMYREQTSCLVTAPPLSMQRELCERGKFCSSILVSSPYVFVASFYLPSYSNEGMNRELASKLAAPTTHTGVLRAFFPVPRLRRTPSRR